MVTHLLPDIFYLKQKKRDISQNLLRTISPSPTLDLRHAYATQRML